MYEKHFHDAKYWPLCCISPAPAPSAIALVHRKVVKKNPRSLDFWNSRNQKSCSWSQIFKFLVYYSTFIQTRASQSKSFRDQVRSSSHVNIEFQCIHTYMSWLSFFVWRTTVGIGTGRQWIYAQKADTQVNRQTDKECACPLLSARTHKPLKENLFLFHWVVFHGQIPLLFGFLFGIRIELMNSHLVPNPNWRFHGFETAACTPPVCISAVIELLAVWRHTKPKTKNQAQASNRTAGRSYGSEVGWRPCWGVDRTRN